MFHSNVLSKWSIRTDGSDKSCKVETIRLQRKRKDKKIWMNDFLKGGIEGMQEVYKVQLVR